MKPTYEIPDGFRDRFHSYATTYLREVIAETTRQDVQAIAVAGDKVPDALRLTQGDVAVDLAFQALMNASDEAYPGRLSGLEAICHVLAIVALDNEAARGIPAEVLVAQLVGPISNKIDSIRKLTA